MAVQTEHSFTKTRIESLSDGVFSTVMTVLVLSLSVPIVTGPDLSRQLTGAIFSLLPNIAAYAASFIVLLVMWIGHNYFFRYIHHVNRKLQWLNGIALLLVGLVPLSTAFLARYPLQQPAIFLYGVNFLLIMVMFNILYRYAKFEHELVHANATTKRRGPRENTFVAVLFSLSLFFSFVQPFISLALFISVPVYYLCVAVIYPE